MRIFCAISALLMIATPAAAKCEIDGKDCPEDAWVWGSGFSGGAMWAPGSDTRTAGYLEIEPFVGRAFARYDLAISAAVPFFVSRPEDKLSVYSFADVGLLARARMPITDGHVIMPKLRVAHGIVVDERARRRASTRIVASISYALFFDEAINLSIGIRTSQAYFHNVGDDLNWRFGVGGTISLAGLFE